MTLIRGGLAEALGAGANESSLPIWPESLNGSWHTSVSWASKPIRSWAAWDASALGRVAAADEIRGMGVGLSPRAGRRRPKPITATQLLGGP